MNVNPSLKIYFLKLRKFGRHSNINFFFLDLESDHIYFSQKHFSQFLFRIRWLRYRKSESQTQYQFGLRLNFSFFGVSFHVPNIKSCQIMWKEANQYKREKKNFFINHWFGFGVRVKDTGKEKTWKIRYDSRFKRMENFIYGIEWNIWLCDIVNLNTSIA